VTNPKIQSRLKNYQNKNRVINKDFEGFRNELLNYAKSNFSNQIQDFSETSLGGMFLDFAAIVGESLSFYIEQQFNELDYETSTSDYNIINHLRKAGVNFGYASPSSVFVDFFIEVPADPNSSLDSPKPDNLYLPVIKTGTKISSNEGINFLLEEDIDFNDSFDNISVSDVDGDNNVTSVILTKKGICISGDVVSESITFDADEAGNFLSYTLSNQNVTKILSIDDNDFNSYKEVEFLSQDTVYEKIEEGTDTFFEVKPASFRYIVERNFDSGFTTIRFGNGSGQVLEDNILTNPEDYLSLPLLGRNYVNRVSLDPKSLLNSDSLGVSPAGKSLNIRYKFGGGESHNISANSVDEIIDLKIMYPNISDSSSALIKSQTNIINSTIGVDNEDAAIGGSNSLSLEDLRDKIPTALKQQSRIVNHEDLLARIYTMPSDFGKIHKAAIVDNPFTKSAKDLFIICKDDNNHYVVANDAIKINLSKFLNEYRLIGDSLNIIDVPVYNFSIFLKVKISKNYNSSTVIQQAISKIFQDMRFETLQIGEGININDIISIVLSVPGIVTIISNYKTIIRSKTNDDITQIQSFLNVDYNSNKFSSRESYLDGIVYPPRGGIFELKYPSADIEIISG
tara:strand:- start:182 stop:2056 length:1875 start_codon:yes stop_codon:yes gene_type:complete